MRLLPPSRSIGHAGSTALFILGTLPAAWSQAPLQTFQSSLFSVGEDFGSGVLALEDLDGDGVQEVWIASGRYGPGNGGQVRGRVRVLSGATGVVLDDLVGGGFGCGPSNTFRADYLCSVENAMAWVGDLDGDQKGDLALAAYNHNLSCSSLGFGRAYFRTSVSPATLHTETGTQAYGYLGRALAGVGDQDGDGTPDVAIGVPGKDTTVGTDAGEVLVLSGAAPHGLLFRVDGPEAGAKFGHALCSFRDITGDSIPEFLVGAPMDDHGMVIDAGSVSVVEGGTGVLLFQVFGTAGGEQLGQEVRLAGDLDGDTLPEFLASTEASVEEVRLFTTFGQQLAALAAPTGGSSFGASFGGLGDIDGDGAPEFAVGAPGEDGPLGTDQGAVYLYSWSGGSPAWEGTLWGFAVDGRFGTSVRDLGSGDPAGSPVLGGDWNGDGMADLLVGAPGDFAGRGAVYVLPGMCLGPERYCTALPNSTGAAAEIDHSGSLSVAANDFVLEANSLPPLQPGLFYYGTFPLNLPFGCGRRCVGGTVVRLGVVYASPSGMAQRVFPFAPSGLAAFDVVYAQYWYRDPAGSSCGTTFNLSDALRLSLCP